MSTEIFREAWIATGRSEGGYADNPHDSGGPTNHGITQAVARANGYRGDMRDLTHEQAEAIAKSQYWDILRLDAIAALSSPVARELFDTGFLHGIVTAGRFLQRALNGLNQSHRPPADWPELGEDGLVGNMTVHAYTRFMAKRGSQGELVLLRLLNCQQGAAMLDLTRRREKDEEFLYGWILHRVAI